MRTGFKALAALLGGAIAGLTSVQWVTGSPGAGGWEDAQAGLADANPYTLAKILLNGRLPLPHPAVQQFILTRDAEGLRLDGDCDYFVEGKLPSANWWSFATGRGAGGQAVRPVLTPDQAIYLQDGTLQIAISRRPQTGNWITPGRDEPMIFTFVMAISGGNSVASPPPAFTLKKGECR